MPDSRQDCKVQHQARDIVFLSVASVICGAQDWEGIRVFRTLQGGFFSTIQSSSSWNSFP
ncbi:MAG: transposase family protein [Cytophagaceae bacterium]|nr:transposase family protein [Cytophagaceae bacterium]